MAGRCGARREGRLAAAYFLAIVGLGCLLGTSQAQESPAAGGPAKTMKMARDADPGWEVATVKPNRDPDQRQHINMHGRHLTFVHHTVEEMLLIGYSAQKEQIVGAPDWARTEGWDVDGVVDSEGQPNLAQLQSMMRKILRERFGLSLHEDRRELPALALTVARHGPSITANTTDPDGMFVQQNWGGAADHHENLKNISMPELVLILQFWVDRPVVDQTGLKGRYDLMLRWSTSDAQSASPDAPPSLFTAIQEQAGLKLESVKAPVRVLVIDKVERPGAN